MVSVISMVSVIKGATLVVGATGATGKHVVQQLLNQDRPVHVIVRSKERMLEALTDKGKVDTLLTITEASVMDLTDEQLQQHANQADNVVCCLGHNMSFQGMYGHPRRLVSHTVERLSKCLAHTTGTRRKLIVMISDGVAHPDGSDDKLTLFASTIIVLCRFLMPHHVDNEAVASYLYNLADTGNMEWIAVRPTILVNGNPTEYKLYNNRFYGLFGSAVVTRANVAKCMVDLSTNDELFAEYKFRMPVLYDAVQPSESSKKES
jgi:nucleoside-diphosphate-sugar epimerase